MSHEYFFSYYCDLNIHNLITFATTVHANGHHDELSVNLAKSDVLNYFAYCSIAAWNSLPLKALNVNCRMLDFIGFMRNTLKVGITSRVPSFICILIFLFVFACMRMTIHIQQPFNSNSHNRKKKQ